MNQPELYEKGNDFAKEHLLENIDPKQVKAIFEKHNELKSFNKAKKKANGGDKYKASYKRKTKGTKAKF